MKIKSKRVKTRRIRVFVPSNVAHMGGMQLEPRALTAPLFFRQPTDTTEGENDFVQAGADIEDQAAGDSPVVVVDDPNTGGETTSTATLGALVVDVAQPDPPFDMDGTGAISYNTIIQVQSTNTGGFALAGNGGTAGIRRSYVLADSSTAGTPEIVTEMYSFAYTASQNSIVIMNGGVGTGSGLAVGFGQGWFTVDGNNITIPSGANSTSGSFSLTIGMGGPVQTVNYSFYIANDGSEGGSVTAYTDMGPLPVAARAADGSVAGVAFPVAGGSTLVLDNSANDMASLTTGYSVSMG